MKKLVTYAELTIAGPYNSSNEKRTIEMDAVTCAMLLTLQQKSAKDDAAEEALDSIIEDLGETFGLGSALYDDHRVIHNGLAKQDFHANTWEEGSYCFSYKGRKHAWQEIGKIEARWLLEEMAE